MKDIFHLRKHKEDADDLSSPKESAGGSTNSSPNRSPNKMTNVLTGVTKVVGSTVTKAKQGVVPALGGFNNAGPNTAVVKVSEQWDIRMPPVKKHMMGGHMVPTMRSTVAFWSQKHRRVSMEIRGPPDDAEGNVKPSAAGLKRKNLEDNEFVVVRILKESKGQGDHDSDDDDDQSVVPSGAADEGNMVVDHSGKHWKTHGTYRLEDIDILKSHGKTVEMRLGSGNETVIRDVKFEGEKEANAFVQNLEHLATLEKTRARQQVELYKSSRTASDSARNGMSRALGPDGSDGDEKINILVEIVSAMDLPVADLLSTDAYVIVRMGGSEVHRTSVISKNLNPIWTLSTGSLFLIQKTPEEFFGATSGMSFLLKDYDAFGANDVLGRVSVSLDEVLKATGERTEYDIAPDKPGKSAAGETAGKLYLRIKPATQDDIEFMKVLPANAKKGGVYIDETYLPPRPPNSKILKRMTKRGENREHLHRVKPFPDPDRPEDQTKWLTEDQIEKEAMKPSTKWVEAGSGSLGKVYFEILKCDKLPNMDATTLNIRDKTDAFACIAFEDCLINTDVIGDSLSPRWPHWSRRAFAFNIDHPSSDMFVSVLDYDPPMGVGQVASRATSTVHDPIARCLLNVSKLSPNTVYTMDFPLFYGELAEHRKKQRGTMTVRMRIEWNDIRGAMIKGIKPSITNYISCAKLIDYQVANYTTEGVHDYNKWSMTTFTKHIEELQSYEKVLPYLQEAGMTLLLWRGHHPVVVAGKTFNLPLHSMTAFAWAILISWNFNLFPSFLVFSIGWAMVASSEYQRTTPSPWHRCRSFFVLFNMLATSKTQPFVIKPNQNIEAVKAFNEAAAEREKRHLKQKELELKHDEELRKELGEEINDAEAGDVDIATQSKNPLSALRSLNPLKGVLYPIQLQLGQGVVALRIAKSIFLWEESYYAFWITMACFAGSLVICWVPWGWVLRWIFRIAVLVISGPWMMIVDQYYFREDPNLTEKERENAVKARLQSRYMAVLQAATNYQIRKERAIKLKDMKRYMFGKYLLRVPRFMEDEFTDIPLPTSYAEANNPDNATPVTIAERKFGQNLSGDMIPVREVQAAEAKQGSDGLSESKKRGFLRARMTDAGKIKNQAERIPLLGKAFGRKSKEYDSTK
jgi:hypothetical protein